VLFAEYHLWEMVIPGHFWAGVPKWASWSIGPWSIGPLTVSVSAASIAVSRAGSPGSRGPPMPRMTGRGACATDSSTSGLRASRGAAVSPTSLTP
jgi:hypothetical protein